MRIVIPDTKSENVFSEGLFGMPAEDGFKGDLFVDCAVACPREEKQRKDKHAL